MRLKTAINKSIKKNNLAFVNLRAKIYKNKLFKLIKNRLKGQKIYQEIAKIASKKRMMKNNKKNRISDLLILKAKIKLPKKFKLKKKH